MAVSKKDGRVRLCGDYKGTINPVTDGEQYPSPQSKDPFSTLAEMKTSVYGTLRTVHVYVIVVGEGYGMVAKTFSKCFVCLLLIQRSMVELLK